MANFEPSLVNSRVAQQLSHMSHIATLEAELELARKQIRMLKKQLGVITRQNEVLKHPWEHKSLFSHLLLQPMHWDGLAQNRLTIPEMQPMV